MLYGRTKGLYSQADRLVFFYGAPFVRSPDAVQAGGVAAGGPGVELRAEVRRYRTEAVKAGGAVTLYSRNEKTLNARFPALAAALGGIPGEW